MNVHQALLAEIEAAKADCERLTLVQDLANRVTTEASFAGRRIATRRVEAYTRLRDLEGVYRQAVRLCAINA